MTEENPSILHHVSVAVSNIESSLIFYDAIFATLSTKRIAEEPGAIAYGKQFPEFWIYPQPFDGRKGEATFWDESLT